MDEFTNYMELADLTTFILVYDCYSFLGQCEPIMVAHHAVIIMLYNVPTRRASELQLYG